MKLESYLAQHAVPLDHDLRALDELAKNARVIMLGEQNHGDGASFVYKAKLINYLHECHGYNVLAFEADFYALEQAWKRIHYVHDITKHVKPQIYSFWTKTAEAAPLWELIENQFAKGTPLVVAGIDPRHSGRDSQEQVVAEVTAFISSLTEPIEESKTFLELLRDMLTLEYAHRVTAFEQETFFAVLQRLHQSSQGYQRAALRNLGFCARNAWSFHGRDEGMSANLEYLACERFPQEKIIVWAHNYHIAKASSLLIPDYHHQAVGGYTDTLLGEGAAMRLDGVVCLALLSAEGWYHVQGNPEQRETFLAPKGTLEAELAAQGFDEAFLDLKHADQQPFSMSAIFHDSPKRKRWAEAFDGVLFLRQMRGLTY